MKELRYKIEVSFDEYVGRKISQFRVEKKLLKGELAKQIGVSGAMMSFIENGKRGTKMSRLIKIAEVLGKQTEDFLPHAE